MDIKESSRQVRIIIVDDQKDVREGLRYLLSLDNRVQILRTFDRAESLLDALPGIALPDIILLDIGLPGINGIEAIRRVKASYPVLTILVFTVFEDTKTLMESIRAGANGYLLKNTKPELLIEQIISAVKGGSPLSPEIACNLINEFKKRDPHETSEKYHLTKREKEILHYVAEGYTFREIASQCSIAPATVKKHILHLYDKLGVFSKAEFVKKVIEEGLDT